jgi:membrane dipeptidase
MLEQDAETLHRDSIVIDAVCPLLQDKRFIDWYIEGGLTVAAPTISSTESANHTMRVIGGWKRAVATDPRLRETFSVAEIERAKRDGKLGIFYHMQGADPVEDNIDLVDVYQALGVRIMQLCYNVKNRVGDGADERTDAGLSNFGVALIRRLNECRVVVDCSHTGYRTSMEAIEASSAPVVISHGNARAIHPSKRNVPDDLIKAVAASGGTVGVVGFPAFVAPGPRPTLDQFIDHIAYLSDLIGPDRVTLGIDYYLGQSPAVPDEVALAGYKEAIAMGVWREETYPPPPHHYPAGIETPRTLPKLTERLLERQFSAKDVAGILGGNLMRVWGGIWGA